MNVRSKSKFNIKKGGTSLTGSLNPIFCDNTVNNQEIDKTKFPSLTDLESDCSIEDPEVECDCCTGC